MIIDPIANRLDPFSQGHHSGGSDSANTKFGEVRSETSPIMENLPPPYTEIDLERGIIEGLETPFSIHSRFLDMDEGNANPDPGIQHIKEGMWIFFNSVMFFTEVSLFALGTCIEGFGKIICGIGIVMKPHRATLCHPVPDH